MFGLSFVVVLKYISDLSLSNTEGECWKNIKLINQTVSSLYWTSVGNVSIFSMKYCYQPYAIPDWNHI